MKSKHEKKIKARKRKAIKSELALRYLIANELKNYLANLDQNTSGNN